MIMIHDLRLSIDDLQFTIDDLRSTIDVSGLSIYECDSRLAIMTHNSLGSAFAIYHLRVIQERLFTIDD